MSDALTTLARALDRDARRHGLTVRVGPCADRSATLRIEGEGGGALTLWPRDPARPGPLRGAALDARLEPGASPRVAAWVAAIAPAALASSPLARELDRGDYDVRSILDVGVETLVEHGLKPTARLSVSAGDDTSRLEARIPVVLRSEPFAFTREGRLDTTGGERRFLYLGRDRAAVERLREIDAILFSMRGPLHDPARSRALRREQGELLGYPPCCVAWFADERPATSPRDELYDLGEALGWDGLRVDPRLSFVASILYKTPVVPHVPCGPACAETARRTAAHLRALYSPWCARVVASLLEVCVVVWPDGHVAPFLLDGEGGVRSFNRAPHPALATEAARLRRIPEDPDDAAVRGLRVEGGRLLVESPGGRWDPWPSSPAGRPLLLVFASSR